MIKYICRVFILNFRQKESVYNNIKSYLNIFANILQKYSTENLVQGLTFLSKFNKYKATKSETSSGKKLHCQIDYLGPTSNVKLMLN